LSLDIERIHESRRKVTKFLRKNSKRPSSDAVHKLRTSIRSLETTYTTLKLDSEKQAKRLLRNLRTIRKAAGKVRDMDVLSADVLTVQRDGEQDCVIQLLEHLGTERNKFVKKLRRVIESNNPQLRQDLKQYSKHVEKRLQKEKTNPADSDAVPLTMTRTIQLSWDLKRPARLNRSNLHSYRLKVKELRDVLQLSDRPGDPKFLGKLGEVKDAIGEWHDWEELVAIARELLDHGPSCKLIKKLKETSDSMYQRALSLTSQLRSHYLKGRGSNHGPRHDKRISVSPAVLSATSAIVED
jgi:CHAD domain-containing protein